MKENKDINKNTNFFKDFCKESIILLRDIIFLLIYFFAIMLSHKNAIQVGEHISSGGLITWKTPIHELNSFFVVIGFVIIIFNLILHCILTEHRLKTIDKNKILTRLFLRILYRTSLIIGSIIWVILNNSFVSYTYNPEFLRYIYLTLLIVPIFLPLDLNSDEGKKDPSQKNI